MFVSTRVNKKPIYTTYRDADDVTYQIVAYRELNADEAKKKVGARSKRIPSDKRPRAGDVVIMETAIGLRSN